MFRTGAMKALGGGWVHTAEEARKLECKWSSDPKQNEKQNPHNSFSIHVQTLSSLL